MCFTFICKYFIFIDQLAESGIYKKVWDNNIRVNEANLLSSKFVFLHRVQTEKFVYFGEVTYLEQLIEPENACDVTMASQRFFKRYLAFAMRKNFSDIDMFNKG